MSSARRARLLADAHYVAVSAPHCVYCLRGSKLGPDHVPPVAKTAKRSKLWPGLFTYPACTECNLSLRSYPATCIVLRTRKLHELAAKNRAGGDREERARARAAATAWALAADAASAHCMCSLCRSART